MPQRAHLFAASLADNIRLGAPDTPADALAAAVHDAALDDVVAGLPDGLDTLLGSAGTGCPAGSGSGWRWPGRFCGPPVVLLDEPTARLDTAAEAVVLDATRRLVAGRTALLVAHRPALLADADRILRVEDGRVTELTPEPTGKAPR